MKRLLCLFCLLVIWGAVACGGGSSEPLAVQTVTLHRDDGAGKPGDKVDSFTPKDHIFHAKIQLNRIESGLKAKLVWIAVDTTEGKNVEVAQTEFSSLAVNQIDGKVELPNDWPAGKYRLDIYLNDKVAKSVEFSVA
jgi:hypothetical protein